MGVVGDLAQCIANVACHDLLLGGRAVSGGIQDTLADQAAVCPGQPRLFLGFAAGDHQPRGDFQLAQHVALLITVRHGFIQVLGRQAGHLIWLFDQTASIGERCQTQAAAGFELNPVDGQPKGGEVIALQTEGITCFDNE
ncbi:hypothetical protein D3C78_1170070 [compost metagenome]